MSLTEIIMCLLALVQGSLGSSWDIELPHQFTGQRGSCVVIPCRYRFPSNITPTQYVGIWFKNMIAVHGMIHNSSNTPSPSDKYKLAGNLENQDCSLIVNDLQRSDLASYQFRIDLGGLSKYTYRNGVRLLVTEPREKPSIAPTQDIVAGKPINISCTFRTNCNGTQSRLSWQHIKGLNALVSETKTQRRNRSWVLTRVLTFTPALGHQGKVLRCRAEFLSDGTQQSVRLEIQYPPRAPLISRGVNSWLTAREGRSAALRCSVESRPASNLTWVRNGETLNSSVHTNTLWLQLSDLTYRHQGEFRCVARNKHGTNSTSQIISIEHSPKETEVRVVGGQLAIREGDNVTLSCFSKSNPPVANYSWFRLGSNNWTEVITNSPSVNLGPVTRDNDTWFYCRAENALGSSDSSPLFISAEYAAVAERHSGCAGGAEVECVCVVGGNPPANITWELEGGVVGGSRTGSGVRVSAEVSGHAARSTLTVKRGPGEFNAVCVGSNRHGETRLKFHLCAKGVLEPLWIGLIGGLTGAVIAAALTASMCSLINATRKNMTGSHQGHVPTDRCPPGSQISGGVASDAHIYQCPQECSGNAGQALLYCSIDYSKLPVSEGAVRRSETTEYAIIKHPLDK
ncbi:myelin-associated glycoprotein-like [Carcharodon carcharias]|uniref:myelin-associated glycoprotein-like n=1 Tax=Carcharodon carcharias TaxID=13397 RepID=UPI001B7E3387|nr:myelin-associated glycoprotein-like [Carcharodon carcharias]